MHVCVCMCVMSRAAMAGEISWKHHTAAAAAAAAASLWQLAETRAWQLELKLPAACLMTCTAHTLHVHVCV